MGSVHPSPLSLRLLSSFTSIFSPTSGSQSVSPSPRRQRSTAALIIMIPPGRLDGIEAREANERESTIYDLVSRDCLTGVGLTCLLALPPQCRTVFDM